MRTWISPAGQVDLPTIRSLFAPDMGPFFVPTAAISVENTHNFAGGAVVPFADLRDLREFATAAGARVHVDGARIWNAHVATGTSLADYGAIADVLAVCLSKGLGAPVGSLMVGEPRPSPTRASGASGWAGACARSACSPRPACTPSTTTSSGSPRTTTHARLLAGAVGVDPDTVDTNIVVFERTDAAAYVERAREAGVLVATVGPTAVRMVAHLGVDKAAAETAARALSSL